MWGESANTGPGIIIGSVENESTEVERTKVWKGKWREKDARVNRRRAESGGEATETYKQVGAKSHARRDRTRQNDWYHVVGMSLSLKDDTMRRHAVVAKGYITRLQYAAVAPVQKSPIVDLNPLYHIPHPEQESTFSFSS